MTRRVALKLAGEIGANLEEIHDSVNREGAWGYLKSGREAMQKKLTVLKPLNNKPQDYDLVIVGTPTWAFTMSSPIRTFLTEQKANLKQVAFFETQGGDGNMKVVEQMAEVCALSPVASLVVKSKEAYQDKYVEKLQAFLEKIKDLN